MAGEDINVEIKEKGIKIIINPYANKNIRKPNALQNVLSEIFNEINSMREDIAKHREATYRFMLFFIPSCTHSGIMRQYSEQIA